MKFIADLQTLDDLNLLDRYSNSSIFSLFNQVKTKGGEMLLDKMFRSPLTDVAAINQRSELFKSFQYLTLTFPLDQKEFMEMEFFLQSTGYINRLTAVWDILRIRVLKVIGVDEEYSLLIRGLNASFNSLSKLNVFFNDLLRSDPNTPFKKQALQFLSLYDESELNNRELFENGGAIATTTLLKYINLFGVTLHKAMMSMLGFIQELDVYIAVSAVAALNGFTYATAKAAEKQVLNIKNCRYPTLKNAKGNDIFINEEQNMLFITGANMAGKSTLMKSTGVNVYLAHMGFPVAANQMEFSIRDGIFSSINLPDNIAQGYSHFYAEVLRVKTVAEEVGRLKNLLVIFDELFKGTNVKDAFDATLAVTDAFAEYENCSFMISTHIIEVAEELKKNHKNILFSKMPTVMNGKVPMYTYQLEEGISADRHGMMIIENEGILEMLK